jgi:F-type H+-transporting ATPase subunit a
MVEISIKAEEIANILHLPITNSLLLSLTILFFFLIFGIFYNNYLSRTNSLINVFIRFCLKGLYTLFESILGSKTKGIFPFLGALFIFIIFSNWAGLLPGVGSILIAGHEHHEKFPILRAPTADLNTTFALAIFAVVAIQYYGFKYLGWNYLKKYINFTNPIMFFIGILEIVSELSKVMSFSFRLFGNIFAGEVLLLVVATLVPVLASTPFLFLEVFVGLIQALVFSMLTAVFLSAATANHH